MNLLLVESCPETCGDPSEYSYMKRLTRLDRGNGHLKYALLSIAEFHWFLNFPDRRQHIILTGLVEWTLPLWYKHHITQATSLCIIGTQETPIYCEGRQISAASSIAILVPFVGVFHAPTTKVWEMSRINILNSAETQSGLENIVMQRIVQYELMVLGMDNSTLKLPVLQEVEHNPVSQGGLLTWKCR